jgi:phosphoesterase RecJ-like protein
MTAYDEIAAVVREHQRFAIASHIGPEGDALGSQLALRLILQACGKEALVVCRDPLPENLRFLEGAARVIFPAKVAAEPIDVWFVVDCGDLSRVGEDLCRLISKHPLIVNMDHHRSNPRFGRINLVDEVPATTVILYQLAQHLGVSITPQLADCLYVGIVADTDSFRNANVNPDVLRVAGELLKAGAKSREISIQLYERRKPSELRLMGRVLSSAQLDDGIIWGTIARETFKDTGTDVNETERLVEELRATDGIRVAVLFKELENGRVKVSLRSKDHVAVNRIAQTFGGGGHEKAAGCLIRGNLAEVQHRVLDELRRHLASNG